MYLISRGQIKKSILSAVSIELSTEDEENEPAFVGYDKGNKLKEKFKYGTGCWRVRERPLWNERQKTKSFLWMSLSRKSFLRHPRQLTRDRSAFDI